MSGFPSPPTSAPAPVPAPSAQSGQWVGNAGAAAPATGKPGHASLAVEGGDALDVQCAKYSPPDPGFWEKGNISNIVTFVVMVAGLAMRFAMDEDWDDNTGGRYVLAFGLFGFAGGVTNWLAVKMLFDEIPGVYGSGIIPKQFKQIRQTMKDMIMDTFFEPEFLRTQLSSKLGSFVDGKGLASQMDKLFDSPDFDKLMAAKLEEMKGTPLGNMVSMMGLSPSTVKPFLKPLASSIASAVAPQVAQVVTGDPHDPNGPILRLRAQVEGLMNERLQELTPDRVKTLIEAVMRAHLGWLVVWGNVFGGCIGVISEAAGY